MDDSERLYKLSAKMSAIVYNLKLSGWATELILEDKSGNRAKVKIKIDVRNIKKRKVGK